MNKTALIDADSFIYIVAWNHKETEDKTHVLKSLDEMLVNMVIKAGCDHYLGVFSPKKTFRNEITDTYKAKRPETPEWVTRWKQTIIDYCVNEHGFVIADGHEADDVLSIMQGPGMVLCHIDKDINQVSGEHYNYNKQTLYEVDQTAATYNFWYQVLVGDTVDNIKGAWKVGPVGAAKILSQNVDNYEGAVKSTFQTKNGENWLQDYEETVSLIRLLQPTPELVAFYQAHIQAVGREADADLVGDILNHESNQRVLEGLERPHESDVLRPPVDLS